MALKLKYPLVFSLALLPSPIYNDSLPVAEEKPDRDDCALLDSFPTLTVPEYVTCTDHGSQEKVVIIYDLNHNDPSVQEGILKASEELYEIAGISLFAREGRLGFIEDVLEDTETQDWVLPSLQQKGANVVELIGPVEEYSTVINTARDYFARSAYAIKDLADKCYQENKTDDCYNPNKYDTRLLDFSYKMMKQEGEKIRKMPDRKELKDIRDAISFDFWFGATVDYYAAVSFRSYDSIDRLLATMAQQDQDTAVLIFGEGHTLQIEGYLDQLGISHMGIVLDKEKYEWQREASIQDEERHFSQDALDQYRYLEAKNAFNMSKYKNTDVKSW